MFQPLQQWAFTKWGECPPNVAPPAAHAASHEDGGSDEISVAGLSGELADDQPPKDHASDHLPSGGDAITTAAPTTGIGAGNTEGSAESFARSDHDHTIRESGGQDLTMAAVADGEFVKRSGTTLAGAAACALTSTAPVDVTKAAAATGTGTTAARHDHKHDVSTGAPGAITFGDINTEGTATSVARSDHKHAFGAPAAPADVTKAAAQGGSSSDAARADHKHDVSTGDPGAITFGDVNTEGTATSVARSDHKHAFGAPAAPADVTKSPAGGGSSSDAARADHKHDVTTAAPAAAGVGATSGEGTATTLARSDHTHQSNTAPADTTKAAAAVGTSTEPARADHKHDVTTAAPSTGIGAGNTEGSATTLARSDHDHKIRESGGQDLTMGAVAEGAVLARSGTTIAGITSKNGFDGTAIHSDWTGEINAIAEKTVPVAADLVLIEDSAASNAKKKVQRKNLVGPSALKLVATGTLSTGNDKAPIHFEVPWNCTVIEVRCNVKTAPTGAAITIAVSRSGVGDKTFSTDVVTSANLQIAAAAYYGNTSVISNAALTKGQCLAVDIDQVGSTIAGADLEVTVIATRD